MKSLRLSKPLEYVKNAKELRNANKPQVTRPASGFLVRAAQKHAEANEGEDAWQIQRQGKIEPEELQISGHEIKHEMITHGTVRKMRVLCRKVTAPGKRADNRKMRAKITEG